MIFKTEPFAHQLTSFNLAKDKKYWGHLHEMGAGKTKIVIDTANYLFDKGELDGVLVLAPNGIHTNWINKELPVHHFHPHRSYNWTGAPKSQKGQRQINQFLADAAEKRNRISWMCMNIEAIRTGIGLDYAEEFMRSGNRMIVVDESTIIKTPKALQTKAALYLASLSKYRRILTGTPITQGPLDFFSQCKFLDKDSIPFTSFTAFRNTFAVERQVVLNSGKRFNQVVGYTKLGYLREIIQPFTDRILKKDCLDLPEKLYQQVAVPMTTTQSKLYRTMKDLYISQLDEQENSTGVVTATNVLTLMMKLQQIATGFIIDDEGIEHEVSNNRIEKLLTLLGETSGKCIIWCAFRRNIHDVGKAIQEAYGKESVVSYFGDTSSSERVRAIEVFQNDDKTRFFISNKTGAEGITLTAAEHSIYFSNTYSLHTRLQSEDRNHRIGQTKNVLYTDLYCAGTVDEAILKALTAKKDIADEVLTNWRELL